MSYFGNRRADAKVWRSVLRRGIRTVNLEAAVAYGIVGRLWSLAAGPVTALMVVANLTPTLQGFYYTFATLVALQVFAELGLGWVVSQFAAHEWAHLSIGEAGMVVGDDASLSRLRSLTRLALRWYGVGAIVATTGLAIGGSFFFASSRAASATDWVMPWITLSVLTGLTLAMVPFWSLLEGCNRVGEVLLFRLCQGTLYSLTLWIALYAGAELWTPALASGVGLIFAAGFVFRRERRFFRSLVQRPSSDSVIRWRDDILPMQWRIAASWVAGYFCFSLFVPVLFRFQGPVVAGQMGLTWSLVVTVGTLPAAWLAPQVPRFGMFVARMQFHELDLAFRRVLRVMSVIAIPLAFAVWALVYALRVFEIPLGYRVLPPLPTAFFATAQVLFVLSLPFAAYIRAHKREPLMPLSLVSAVLVAASTYFFGKFYSATAVAAGYLAISAVTTPFVVLIWFRCRRAWHPVTTPTVADERLWSTNNSGSIGPAIE